MTKMLQKVKDKFNKIYYTIGAVFIKRSNRNHNIILVGTPNTPNLGDHLITEAEYKFLHDKFCDYGIVEIPGDYIRYASRIVKSKVCDNDLIIITGGGFMGNLWMSEENMVRYCLKLFINNKIIFFPQTVYFENDSNGKKEFLKSLDSYKKHSNIWMIARERYTYNFLKEKMPGVFKQLILVPDIALYLNKELPQKERKDILICLREDVESTINNNVKNTIIKIGEDSGYKLKFTDTVIKKNVNTFKREKFINNKLDEFKSSKLVITDRLHGMIMAAITCTPCIVFNNKTSKVKGVYEWIKDLQYIRCVENPIELENNMKRYLNSNQHFKYDTNLNKYYDIIQNTIVNIINE